MGEDIHGSLFCSSPNSLAKGPNSKYGNQSHPTNLEMIRHYQLDGKLCRHLIRMVLKCAQLYGKVLEHAVTWKERNLKICSIMCKIIYKHQTTLKEDRNTKSQRVTARKFGVSKNVLVILKVWETQLRNSDKINVNVRIESKRPEICFPVPADGGR